MIELAKASAEQIKVADLLKEAIQGTIVGMAGLLLITIVGILLVSNQMATRRELKSSRKADATTKNMRKVA